MSEFAEGNRAWRACETIQWCSFHNRYWNSYPSTIFTMPITINWMKGKKSEGWARHTLRRRQSKGKTHILSQHLHSRQSKIDACPLDYETHLRDRGKTCGNAQDHWKPFWYPWKCLIFWREEWLLDDWKYISPKYPALLDSASFSVAWTEGNTRRLNSTGGIVSKWLGKIEVFSYERIVTG